MAEGTRSTRRCTAGRKSGDFCDAPTAPGAPYPICIKHAAEVFAYVRDLGLGSPTPAPHRKTPPSSLPAELEVTAVVYYLRIGDDIKIGWSGNLRRRLHAYPPSATVLAIELGDRSLEKARHEQFAHLSVGGREWFTAGPELMAHIAALTSRFDLNGVGMQRCA